MKNNYTRYQGKSDDTSAGTFVVQTSGNAALTGDALFIRDFNYHGYQLIPISGSPHQGTFFVEVSNDGANWTPHYSGDFSDTTGSNLSYSNDWLFKYARPVLTGNAGGYYLINEIHGKF